MTSISAAILLTTSLLSTPAVPPAPPAAPIAASAAAISGGAVEDQPQFARTLRREDARRPKALIPMYAGFVALQGYDVYSTTTALRGGATEANPLMRNVVKNPMAFLSVKGATTLGSIYGAERLWRAGHRKAAVMVMAVTSGMMAAVAANNARVLRQAR